MLNPKDIEAFNHRVYEHQFTVEHVSLPRETQADDYFRQLSQIRLNYLGKYAAAKKVLDIGCGSGDYLFEIQNLVSFGQGIDYTEKAINAARLKKQLVAASHLEFTKANARQLPFEDESFDLLFSFSALAYMPALHEVVDETLRVLKTGGVAILEMGNLNSLNTLVCEAYTEYTKPCHLRLAQMKSMLTGFDILEWHAFGILPFWGRKPDWLKPLLHPVWKRLFQQHFMGRMLDEWVSNTFVFKPWAYRHFIIGRKK